MKKDIWLKFLPQGIWVEDIQGAYDLGFESTHKQLRNWGVKFHELIMGKPSFDILIDDKAINYNTEWMDTLE